MGSHEFSRNQKIVTDGFPWTLGTQLKNCFQWELKSWGLEYIVVLNNYLGYSDNHAANLSFH